MKYIAFIACLFFSVQMCAQRYVLFNPSCTERFKYNNQFGEEHIVYAIQLGTTERIFLEIGEEAKTYKARISGALISCNNPSLSRNIVNQINGNVGTTFFMVRKEGKGKYLVSPIKAASYFNYDNVNLEYASADYTFVYNMRNSRRNTNLNTLSTATQVFFVGTTNYDCRKGYTFSLSDRNGSLSDLTILPEIGVVDNVAFNTKRRLATINATNFVDYLSAVCNGNTIYTDPSLGGVSQSEIDFESDFQSTSGNYRTPPVTTPTMDRTRNSDRDTRVATERYNEPTARPTYQQPTARTSTPNTNSTYTPRVSYPPSSHLDDYVTRDRLATEAAVGNRRAATTDEYGNRSAWPAGNSGTHTVRKKETLYGISKTYGVSVEDLMRWNKLNSTLIHPGNQLTVQGNRDTFLERGDFLSNDTYTNTTPTSRPVRQTTEPAAPNNRYGRPAWQSTNGIHIVKSGETFTSIAKMYGYTLDRFLDLNGLSVNTTIYPGQKLKTTDCSARHSEVDHRPNPSAVRTNHFDFDDGEFNEKGETPRNDVPAPYFSAQSRFVGTSDPRQNLQRHRVRDREDLYTIARQYNTTVERLKYLNNMEVVEALLPGQIVFVQ